MKTASYFTFFGEGRIGISIGSPRKIPAGYRMFKTLAPRRDMLRLPYDAYRRLFLDEILAPLDPQETFDQLGRLVEPAEPVLLCFERPPFSASNWCHRRMVAEWFADSLGVDVPELTPSPRPASR